MENNASMRANGLAGLFLEFSCHSMFFHFTVAPVEAGSHLHADWLDYLCGTAEITVDGQFLGLVRLKNQSDEYMLVIRATSKYSTYYCYIFILDNII